MESLNNSSHFKLKLNRAYNTIFFANSDWRGYCSLTKFSLSDGFGKNLQKTKNVVFRIILFSLIWHEIAHFLSFGLTCWHGHCIESLN